MSTFLQIIKAMADESRLRILLILQHGSYNVAELTEILQMGQSRVSRHLKLLLDAQLTCVRREGTWAYYDSSSLCGSSPLEPDSQSPKESEKSGKSGDRVQSTMLELLGNDEFERGLWAEDEIRREACLERRRQKDREFHDRLAPSWSQLRDELYGDGEMTRRLLKTMDGGKVVVDLGCGPGVLLPELAHGAYKVIGVDSSQAMLEQARSALADLPDGARSRIELRLGSLEHLPLADSEAQVALMSMVLHHLADPLSVLSEVRRVLAPGGRLVICDLARHEEEWMRDEHGDQWLGFDEDEIGRFLDGAGFSPLSIERFDDSFRAGVVLAQAQVEG